MDQKGYTSIKVPKIIVENFTKTEESQLYRNFSEWVMETLRNKIRELTLQENVKNEPHRRRNQG